MAMACHSSGGVQSYPVPVCGPAQPSKPNPAWGLNAQNHSKCILVMAMFVLPTATPHTTTVVPWCLASRHAAVRLHHTSSDDVCYCDSRDEGRRKPSSLSGMKREAHATAQGNVSFLPMPSHGFCVMVSCSLAYQSTLE